VQDDIDPDAGVSEENGETFHVLPPLFAERAVGVDVFGKGLSVLGEIDAHRELQSR
jgi:hypothetical protein